MINTIQKYIVEIVSGSNLTNEEAENAFQIIMNGGATPGQMAAFLVGLRMKGESVAEIAAGARVMRHKATPFEGVPGAIDTCGTGGDGQGTLNISTAVAIIVAACGVPVVKHGNRSVSSNSGSSDVFSALGVNVDASLEILREALLQTNLTFLMAPRFHSAMRHVAPVRKELGMRTIFNLIGPLSNPARPKLHVLGVYDRKWLIPMAQVLKELGSERAWIVHGGDGLDELTVTTKSYVAELKHGTIREFTIQPETLGLQRADLESLTGRDPDYNAQQLSRLLSGGRGPYRDIVLLNSAAALVVASKVESLEAGIDLAADAIDNRKAKQTLARLASITSDNEIYKSAQHHDE